MEIQGVIKQIDETKTFGSSGFRKREMVVTTEENYPQPILVEFVQEKVDLLSAFRPGQRVKIAINLKGREWTSPQGEVKFFNSIQGWRIESLEEGAGVNPNMPPMPPMEAYQPGTDQDDDEIDDLPF